MGNSSCLYRHRNRGWPVRAAIYIRVSSDDQARHGYSLDSQRLACRAKAEALGANDIVECADEGVSGSILDRPGLTQLRNLVRSHAIQLVVMYDPDRFARRLSHQLLVTEEIEKASVALEFINFDWQDTPEGKLFYSMRGAISEYEREKIRMRTMAGRTQKARSGKLPFSMAPYGYHYDVERAQLIVFEPEAEVVRRMFSDLVGRVSGLNGLAKRLTAEGIPTRTGRSVWHRQVVRQIVMNSVYMGVYYANRRNMTGLGHNRYHGPGEKASMVIRDRSEWIPVEVPAIVDADTWHQAQEIMQRRGGQWRAAAVSTYLLSGLLRCGLCGQTMTGRNFTYWGRKVREYTCIKNVAGARHPGCGRHVRASELDEVVWERVVQWIQKPQVLATRLDSHDNALRIATEVHQTERSLDKLRASQSALLQVLEDDLGHKDDVLARLARLKKRENALRTHYEELTHALHEAVAAHPSAEALEERARQYLERLSDTLPLDERRLILRQFVVSIVVGHDTLTMHAKFPDGNPQKAPQEQPLATRVPR